ncbi:hypothetical protein [Candidatus Tisiphia endosymbiont of Beris chalybata]|uniref:hypothetical protein n=1 Tax=Candidatus Tisiphia endosymbiont of Beris chalybata TaxID=3066262 RepID=UPI00312CA46E
MTLLGYPILLSILKKSRTWRYLVLQELDFIMKDERTAYMCKYSLGYYDTYMVVCGKHSSHAYSKINTLYAP